MKGDIVSRNREMFENIGTMYQEWNNDYWKKTESVRETMLCNFFKKCRLIEEYKLFSIPHSKNGDKEAILVWSEQQKNETPVLAFEFCKVTPFMWQLERLSKFDCPKVMGFSFRIKRKKQFLNSILKNEKKRKFIEGEMPTDLYFVAPVLDLCKNFVELIEWAKEVDWYQLD